PLTQRLKGFFADSEGFPRTGPTSGFESLVAEMLGDAFFRLFPCQAFACLERQDFRVRAIELIDLILRFAKIAALAWTGRADRIGLGDDLDDRVVAGRAAFFEIRGNSVVVLDELLRITLSLVSDRAKKMMRSELQHSYSLGINRSVGNLLARLMQVLNEFFELGRVRFTVGRHAVEFIRGHRDGLVHAPE